MIPYKIRDLFSTSKHLIQMAGIYLGSVVLDFVSSLRIKAPEEESNAFARHFDGSFWPQHAILNEGLNALTVLFYSLMLLVGLRPLGRRISAFVAGLPWLYYAWGHVEAAFFNSKILWFHLYVETYREFLQRILGAH